MIGNHFRHEALLYAGEADFLLGTTAFIRRGLEQDEAVLVVESTPKIAALRRELGEDASFVHFADMAQVGANPARIIPAWRDFVTEHGSHGKGMRGIGEPIWAGRTPDELVECQRHESLLNLAFAGGTPWQLLCPYDITALPAQVIDEARRSHAYVTERHVELPSPQYRGHDESAAMLDAPLRPAPPDAAGMPFRNGDLARVRALASRHAAEAGLGDSRIRDFVSAVNEVATNSLRHGGGAGTFFVWEDDGGLACEVRDRGRYDKPLADRERPAGTTASRGLWLANHLCDLVQIRSYPTGTVVRLLMRVAAQARLN
jgi:anti-sigma regulatory factor (Ser/Thr protein kinase)